MLWIQAVSRWTQCAWARASHIKLTILKSVRYGSYFLFAEAEIQLFEPLVEQINLFPQKLLAPHLQFYEIVLEALTLKTKEW